MKPYFQHTEEERLQLSNEELCDAIKLEAIERGLKPPIDLSEALSRSEWRGYQAPAKSIPIYTIKVDRYAGEPKYGYLEKCHAERAMEGMVKLEFPYNAPARLAVAEPTVEIVAIGVSPATSKGAKFQEYFQDDKDYLKLVEECMDDFSRIRQAAYDAKVRAERKVEYLRLAQGNEEIAKGFWAKAERTEWPA